MQIKENQEPIMVTIRCLTYNHKSYIRQCLEGFIMQNTNFRFEAIVHDDASTDGTTEILREYASNYPEIIKPIYETENQYSKHDGSIMRIMNEQIRGKYVAVCEGDDYWIDPLKLQKQVDFLEKNPNVSFLFTARYIDNEFKGLRIKQTYKNRDYTYFDILSGFNPGLQTVCARREIFESNNFKLGINGDRQIPLLASKIGIIKCINDVTSVYRVTGEGVFTKITSFERFRYAFTDFYNFHKRLNFPDRKSYLKGQSRYIAAELKRYSPNIIRGLIKSYNMILEIDKKFTIVDYWVAISFALVEQLKKKFYLSDIRNRKIAL